MALPDDHVHPESRADWRAWLAAHHADRDTVWLVTWKSVTGRASVGYEDSVLEALCFGWVDSKKQSVDDERSAQCFTRRKPASPWSLTNKKRVADLEAAGLMTGAGRAAIAAAQANGMWTIFDDAQNLVVAADLAIALAAAPGAREHWDSFPPSARRLMLEWLALARRPETRAARILEIATRAAAGERAR